MPDPIPDKTCEEIRDDADYASVIKYLGARLLCSPGSAGNSCRTNASNTLHDEVVQHKLDEAECEASQ